MWRDLAAPKIVLIGGRSDGGSCRPERTPPEVAMLVASWHPVPCPDGIRMAFATHLHGRDAMVLVCEGESAWHWRVVSPAGHVLAEGVAPSRDVAEQAAEDEVCAVHPPTPHLLDEMLTR